MVGGAQELHVSDKLDLTLPKTICRCLEWSSPTGKISNQLPPGPVGCGQGHWAIGRSHPAGVVRAQEPRVAWATGPQHGPGETCTYPGPEAPWPYQSETEGRAPRSSCPNGVGACGSHACAPRRWETLHRCDPWFLSSSASSLLLVNWVCTIWEASKGVASVLLVAQALCSRCLEP